MTAFRTRDPLLPDGSRPGRVLTQLLADAAAPAAPEELTGLSLALASFAVRPTRRPHLLRRVVTPLLAAKAAALGVGAVGIGGVALAAATGVLPGVPQAPNGPDVRASASASAVAGSGAVLPASGRAPGAQPRAAASPAPSLPGLCRAYLGGTATSRGMDLEGPAFAALVRAAGGRAAVPAFCAASAPRSSAPHRDRQGKTARTQAPGARPTPSPGIGSRTHGGGAGPSVPPARAAAASRPGHVHG